MNKIHYYPGNQQQSLTNAGNQIAPINVSNHYPIRFRQQGHSVS